MNNTQKRRIDELVSRAHSSLMTKHNIDLKSIINDKTMSASQKHGKLVSLIKKSFKEKHDYDIPTPARTNSDSYVGGDYPYTDTIWITKEQADIWASDSRSSVESAIKACESLLKIDEEGTNFSSEIAAAGGILGVGTAWLGGGLSIMSGIMSAGAAAFASGGAAAASAVAVSAATAAGLSSELIAAAGTAAAAAGATGASTFGGLAGVMGCMAAFALTPLGALVIGAAVVLAIAAFLVLLLTTDHNFTGIVINDTDQPLKLYGGSQSQPGLYTSEGTMMHFPGVIDDSDPNNPQLEYAGLPARKIVSSDTSDDRCIPVGLFSSEGNQSGKGSLGFFSLADTNNTNIVFLYSNYLAGGASGVYIDTDPLTDTQENIFKRLNDARSFRVDKMYGDRYALSASCDGPAGAEAYGIYHVISNTLE